MSRLNAFSILAVAALLSAPAAAVDLTGTWLGKFTCTAFDGVKDKFTVTNDVMEITQTGDLLAVDANFSGFAIPDDRKPDEKGEVGMAHCQTDADLSADPGELARLKVKVNRAKGKGKLKGKSIYTDGGEQIGSCKWSYKLVDTADPVVLACP